MTTTNVICIRWGTAFGPEYVNRLHKAARRNSSRDVRFFCMTDDRTGIDSRVEILDLQEEAFLPRMLAAQQTTRKGPMRKISMFNPELVPDLDGPLLAFDLDVVLTGNIDELADYAPGKVSMRYEWGDPETRSSIGHGSVLKFEPSRHAYLYENMARDPETAVLSSNGSEQTYTSSSAVAAGDFEPFPDRWIVSFKLECRPKRPLNLFLSPRLPKDARVVCFHGRPKIDEAVAGYRSDPLHSTRPAAWLTEAWSD